MTITHTETIEESEEPPMKDAKIIVLMEDLEQLQAKGLENAAQQLNLTKSIGTALKDAQDFRQKGVEQKNDVGGEG